MPEGVCEPGTPRLIVFCGAKTRVITVTELSTGFTSGVDELTVVVLLISVPSATELLTVAIILIVSEAPTAREGNVTTRLFPDPLHTPFPAVLQDLNVTPDGRLSVTTTEVAVLGPLLVTVIVYVISPPTITGLGEEVIVTAKSAEAVAGRVISRLSKKCGPLLQLLLLKTNSDPGELLTAPIAGPNDAVTEFGSCPSL
jgi:hypothetical protein